MADVNNGLYTVTITDPEGNTTTQKLTRRQWERFDKTKDKQQGRGQTRFTSYRYVSWLTHESAFQIRIQYQRKVHYLGYFDDDVEAARVADSYIRQFYGTGKSGESRCNFPSPAYTKAEARRLEKKKARALARQKKADDRKAREENFKRRQMAFAFDGEAAK